MEHAAVSPSRFARIVVVFNPDPEKTPVHAVWLLCAELSERLPDMSIELRATKHAGHGQEIVKTVVGEVAGTAPPVLIVSVSGDGGYNDVVNGVMDLPGSNIVSAVLAAGNANDHDRSTRSMPLVDAIIDGPVRPMDLLRLTITEEPGATVVRYAHSYIGFGLTAAMAQGIERAGKGKLRELFGVARTLPRLRPFEIERADGYRASLDSLVFANVDRMAKYGTISEALDPSDGRFEVITSPQKGRWGLISMTLRAVTVGLGEQPSVERYAFTAIEELPLQLDGELLHVPAGSEVLVESAHRAIQVIG